MLIEQQWRIDLTIEAFVELEDNISVGTAFWSIILRQFHVDWALLWTLTESKCKINLSGVPTMGGSKQ